MSPNPVSESTNPILYKSFCALVATECVSGSSSGGGGGGALGSAWKAESKKEKEKN